MYQQQQLFYEGKYYMIVCKKDEKAISVAGPNEKSKVIGSNINPQDNQQIFLFNRVDQSINQFQIVNCWTDYVLQDNDREILLAEGKKSKYQKFSIEKVTSGKDFYTYFNIRLANKRELALGLQGSLRLCQFDQNSISQQFRIQQVNNITIQNSFVLVNNYTQKVVDIPKSSDKKGQRIGTWQRNNRWNQRWYWQKVGKNFLIKSVINEMCLDIYGESKENGAKIVQWPQTGGTNQLWYLEEMGNKRYKIWSYHKSSLCLAIRNQDKEDGAYLQVSHTENPTMYWRIQGALPK